MRKSEFKEKLERKLTFGDCKPTSIKFKADNETYNITFGPDGKIELLDSVSDY